MVTREPEFPSPHCFSIHPALLLRTGMEVTPPALLEQLVSHQVLGGVRMQAILCLSETRVGRLTAATRCPPGSGAAPHGFH